MVNMTCQRFLFSFSSERETKETSAEQGNMNLSLSKITGAVG